jgi:hypothetical protein
MPRSRTATQEEVRAVFTACILRIFDETVKPRGKRQLQKLAAWHPVFRQFLMEYRQKPPVERVRFREMLRVKLAASIAEQRMTVNDLRVIEKSFAGAILVSMGLASVPEVLPSPKVLGGVLERMRPRKIRPHKYKHEFVQAFKARKEALLKGKVIPIPRLAKEYTAADYARNEASAIRKMARAMQRIECERQRLIAGGVESPY